MSTEGERIWGLLCMTPSRGMRTSDIPLAGDQPLSSPLESRIGFGQSWVLGPGLCWSWGSSGWQCSREWKEELAALMAFPTHSHLI